jgi:hypothetical protein
MSTKPISIDEPHGHSTGIAIQSTHAATDDLSIQQGSKTPIVDDAERDMSLSRVDIAAFDLAATTTDASNALAHTRPFAGQTIVLRPSTTPRSAPTTPKSVKPSSGNFFTPAAALDGDKASSSAFPATSAHVSASASLLPPASSSVEHKSPLIAAADRHILELLNSSSVISVGGTQYNDDCRAVYAALERAVALRILLGPTSAPLAGTDTSVAAKTISPPVHEIPSVPIALSPAPVVSQSLGDPATTAFSPSASDVMRTPVTLKPDPAATVSASVEPSVAAFFQLHGHKDSAAGVLATVLADNNLDASEIPVLTSIAPLELGRYFMASERWLRRHGSNHIRTLHSYSVKGINTLASVHVSLRDQLCGSAASTLTDVEFLALIKPFCAWDTFWANMQGFARLELAADCLGGWAAFCKWSTDLQRRLELTPNPPSPTDVAKFVLKNGVSPFVRYTLETEFALVISKWTIDDLRTRLSVLIKNNDCSIRAGYVPPASSSRYQSPYHGHGSDPRSTTRHWPKSVSPSHTKDDDYIADQNYVAAVTDTSADSPPSQHWPEPINVASPGGNWHYVSAIADSLPDMAPDPDPTAPASPSNGLQQHLFTDIASAYHNVDTRAVQQNMFYADDLVFHCSGLTNPLLPLPRFSLTPPTSPLEPTFINKLKGMGIDPDGQHSPSFAQPDLSPDFFPWKPYSNVKRLDIVRDYLERFGLRLSPSVTAPTREKAGVVRSPKGR